MIDKFRINWTEKSKENNTYKVVTSITGFNYQIDDWCQTYWKQYDPKVFGTKKVNSVKNPDGTLTVVISRTEKPKEQ